MENEYNENLTENVDTSQDFMYGSEQPTEQEVVPVEQPADNWQTRASYFQSEYDKLKHVVQPYMPVIRLLEEKPELIDVLQKAIAPQEPAIPEKPAKPVKPADYNVSDAINDPDSNSYKYREAIESYQEQIVNYYDTLNDMKLKQQEQLEQQARMAYEQQKQAQTQQRMMVELSTSLGRDFNMSPQEQAAFIKDMSDPSSINIANLVSLWRSKQQQGNREMYRKPNQPIPPVFGGAGNQPMNADQAFANMLRTK